MADMRLEPFDQSAVSEVGVGDEHLPDSGRRGAITQAVLVSKRVAGQPVRVQLEKRRFPVQLIAGFPSEREAVVLRFETPSKVGYLGVGETQPLLDLAGAEVDPVAAV